MVALNDLGIPAVGLDESSWMGRIAYNRLVQKNYAPRLVNANAEIMPFQSGSFDQIIATFPSDYIFSNETLAEAHRMLKANGTLTILPFAWINGKQLPERIMAWLFRITGQAPEADISYLEKELKEPFNSAGFVTSVECRQLDTSVVLIINAYKPKDPKI
jgi:ubiquinone/menaquinone biosynthesis C-methylase UbiE